MKISKLRSVFPKAHVLALTGTGTATTKTIKTIKDTMALRNVKVVKTSIVRNNIKLNVYRRQPTNTHIWQMGLSPIEDVISTVPATLFFTSLSYPIVR